ncbi:hypothetical protein SEPCBS119000_000726 [Sporothrix epigloea]|uniref:Protein-tyrosine phosphatase 2 n=1 Tax=Sporothrix epigloea TaxID=1892477 RepID=A0ABP0D8H3_9PEZI
MDRFSGFRRRKKVTAAAGAGVDAATTESMAAADSSAQGQPSSTNSPPTATTTTTTPTSPTTLTTSNSHEAPGRNKDSWPRNSNLQQQSASSSPGGLDGSITPGPTGQQKQAPDQQARRDRLHFSRSPLHTLLRTSMKRARRSPSPAATPVRLPSSPTAGLSKQIQGISLPSGENGVLLQGPLQRFAGAKPPLSRDRPLSSLPKAASRPPTMPLFLSLSRQEIEQKFQDLTWLEHSRMQNSAAAPHGRWKRVSGPHLRRLDRYSNIQPWDKNRVRLKVSPGQVDYINASPIVLTSSAPVDAARPPDRYIAMQGPKQCSVGHVWRMVYEQMRSPAVIVMLTETHEGNQEKCFPYFPQRPQDPPMLINEHDEFGDGFLASVRCEAIEETPYGDAIELRRIVLCVHKKAACSQAAAFSAAKNLATDATGTNRIPWLASNMSGVCQGDQHMATNDLEDGENGMMMSEPSDLSSSTAAASAQSLGDAPGYHKDEHVVYHFLFKRWPDYGVPAMEDLDSFLGLMRLSAERNAGPDNPRIVHCSAGVGRSGTFIALEHLLLELEAGALASLDGNEATGADEATVGSSEGPDDQERRERSPILPQQRDSPGLVTGTGVYRSARLLGMSASASHDPIYTTVNQLREQRRTMVQAESQYQLIYQVLRKLWEKKYGMAESDDEPTRRQSEDSSGGGVALDGEGADEADILEPAAKRFEIDPANNWR